MSRTYICTYVGHGVCVLSLCVCVCVVCQCLSVCPCVCLVQMCTYACASVSGRSIALKRGLEGI